MGGFKGLLWETHCFVKIRFDVLVYTFISHMAVDCIISLYIVQHVVTKKTLEMCQTLPRPLGVRGGMGMRLSLSLSRTLTSSAVSS